MRGLLEIASGLVYAYRYVPIVQARKMANPEHLALLQQGVEAWNEWRQSNPNIKPNLSKANLSNTGLHGADLSGTNLRGVDLRGADLSGAVLRGAVLRGADLRDLHSPKRVCKADFSDRNSYCRLSATEDGPRWIEMTVLSTNLSNADLSKANLSKANLSGAVLREAVLRETNLNETNLNEAKLQETIFSNVDLTEVEGLDTCRHYEPSTLDFRTLQQSGPLPLTFLRGCGLPDLLIDYLPSLLNNQPIQYYSCFISYSSKDEKFARRLHADLQDNGVRCWFAPKDIQGGRKIYEQLGEAIRLHEKLLLILSEHSMNSEWVRIEIAKARQREEREKRQVLFPIRLVDYETIEQWECFNAHEIREYFIPDFSNWENHKAYQPAFDRLLRDLKPALERKPETT